MKMLGSLSALISSCLALFSLSLSYAQPVTVMDGPYQIVTMDLPNEQVSVTVLAKTKASTDLIYYQGPCEIRIQAELSLTDQSATRAFEASGKIEDLGSAPLTERFARQFAKTCPQTETIEALLANRPDRPVIASFSMASGWKNTMADISAEVAANPLDGLMPKMPTGPVIPFSANDPFLGITTKSYVECAPESAIFMSAMNALAARQPRLNDYRAFAESAAPHFKEVCSDVERIKFRPQTLPDGFRCFAEGADCFFDTRLSSGRWTAEPSGYERASNEESIKSFDDILSLIKSTEYSDIRRNYAGYFKQFHNQFLNVYSAKCAGSVADPVSFQVTPIERTIDGNGITVASRQAGKSYTLTIDRKFEASYFEYEGAIKLRLLDRILQGALSARSGGGSSTGIEAVVGQVISERQRLETFINQRCEGSEVLTVYGRLSDVLKR